MPSGGPQELQLAVTLCPDTHSPPLLLPLALCPSDPALRNHSLGLCPSVSLPMPPSPVSFLTGVSSPLAPSILPTSTGQVAPSFKKKMCFLPTHHWLSLGNQTHTHCFTGLSLPLPFNPTRTWATGLADNSPHPRGCVPLAFSLPARSLSGPLS